MTMTRGPIAAVSGSARALDDRRTDKVHGPHAAGEAAQLARELVGSLGPTREHR